MKQSYWTNHMAISNANKFVIKYSQTSNISNTLVGYKIVDHSDVALLQLHFHSRLNTWLQWIGQRQYKTRQII